MKDSIGQIVGEVNRQCASHCKCSATDIHGISHLCQVANIAGRIAHATKVCIKSAVVGGYLHDCARHDDGDGNTHAHKSAKIAYKLLKKYYPDIDVNKVCHAIYYHADGLTSNDRLIGSIWDADRITLTRLGITTQRELLSTEIAKRFCRFRSTLKC